MPDIQTVHITIFQHGFRQEIELAIHDVINARLLADYLRVKGIDCVVHTRYLHALEQCPVCGREDRHDAI
jgi:hypothetical protein